MVLLTLSRIEQYPLPIKVRHLRPRNITQRFLKERTIFNGFLPPYAMNPELIQPHAMHRQAFPATKQCWEGIVCKLCGRCNLRRHWDAWRCRTEGCPFEHRSPLDVIPASSVMGDDWHGFQGHGVPQKVEVAVGGLQVPMQPI